jgi:hypothetical protein
MVEFSPLNGGSVDENSPLVEFSPQGDAGMTGLAGI